MSIVSPRSKRREEAALAWGLRLLVFVFVAVFWQISAARLGNLLIPTFTDTVAGVVRLVFVSGRLWEPLLISNQALVLGYFFSVLIGVPLGLAAGRNRWVDRLLNPYIGLLLAVPVAPLIPIVITALGLGLASRVLLVVLFAFIFITVNTRAGVRNVDASLIEMARSFGANEGQIWRKIVIPGAMPAIFAGLRIGLGRAIAGMVIIELLLVASGVGRLLLEFTGRLQADLVFATVFAIVAEAVLLMTLMRVVEQKIAPWAHGASIG